MGIDQVEFAREGGFTGIPLTANIKSESLTSEETATLEELLSSIEFFGLPPRVGEQKGADRFQYIVSVEADGKRHSVRIMEPAPEKIHRLLKFLMKLAKERQSQNRSRQ